MKPFLKLISIIGLLVTIIPSFLVFANIVTPDTNKLLMIVGTLLWFSSAPFWMNKES